MVTKNSCINILFQSIFTIYLPILQVIKTFSNSFIYFLTDKLLDLDVRSFPENETVENDSYYEYNETGN